MLVCTPDTGFWETDAMARCADRPAYLRRLIHKRPAPVGPRPSSIAIGPTIKPRAITRSSAAIFFVADPGADSTGPVLERHLATFPIEEVKSRSLFCFSSYRRLVPKLPKAFSTSQGRLHGRPHEFISAILRFA